MTIVHREIRLATRGDGDLQDLTGAVADRLRETGVREGTVNVFVPGSTCGITTIEYEPGLIEDFPAAMERLAPRGIRYAHDDTWHDGNGHSHVRASVIGASLTVPIVAGKLALGTWQQIVLVDFDNRARQRTVIVTVMGE